MNQVTQFFELPFFSVLGGVLSLVALFGLVAAGYAVLKGLIPVWYRLGFSLAKREIAIFAEKEFDNLKDVLVDSGLFKEKNIVKITGSSYKKAAHMTVFLVDYGEWGDDMQKIIDIKKDKCAMIVYASGGPTQVTKEHFALIGGERNSTIVNHRGRLLNDVFLLAITTSYAKDKH